MAKKDMETFDIPDQEQPVSEQVSAENTSPRETSERNISGIYCYIGPSIRGLIRHGDVFRGSRKEALAMAAEAIEKHPLVKTLIVSGDALPSARLKVKTPGNALHENYQRITGRH